MPARFQAIVTLQRTHDWIAYLGDMTRWEAGQTEAEAIGKLVITRQLELAVTVTRDIGGQLLRLSAPKPTNREAYSARLFKDIAIGEKFMFTPSGDAGPWYEKISARRYIGGDLKALPRQCRWARTPVWTKAKRVAEVSA